MLLYLILRSRYNLVDLFIVSVPRTLRNKPRVNYAVLNSGLEAPSRSSSEMVQAPIPKENLTNDRAEHKGIRGSERSFVNRISETATGASLLDQKREVDKLRQAVKKLLLANSNPFGRPHGDSKVLKTDSMTKPLVTHDDLRQIESLSRDVDRKLQHFGLGDATDESRSNSDVDGYSSED